MSAFSPEQWQEISPYLDHALSLSEQERAEWLSDFRAQRSDIANLVEELLEEQRALSQEHFLEGHAQQPLNEDALIGETLGAYKLVSRIGQGGMGNVWLAKRVDGRFERQVAVKFLHFALASQGAAERFRREGRILGQLRDPHIAELVDAGVTPKGEPYLVLEYVQGHHIDEYCDKQKLGVDARIELFLDVLGAVAHAHASLVVHRDIKPSNVLVSAEGEVKLLDFGIAKLLADDTSPAAATLTLEGGGVMTPLFAAPEQVTGGAVTTATDVYGLGLLLYLLLTGQHPAGTDPHSPADLIKAITETEPRLPSEAIALEDGQGLAQARGTTPEKLRRQLRGDLDTILSKALKKNPAERYGSVVAMANDLGRYLKHEPISAHPDTIGYRAAKFVRRHRAGVALTAVALIAVIAGLSGTLMQSRNARRQRDAAIRERDRANRIRDFMTGMFKVSDPNEKAAKEVTARQILDKASGDINTGLAKDPELQAQMMHVMGNVYTNLGLYDRAQSLLELAIEVNRAARGPGDPETLSTMDSLGGTLVQLGRYSQAEKLQREALEGQRRALGPEHPDTLVTMGDLAGTLAMEGHLEEAEKLGRETLEKQRRVLGAENHHTIVSMDTLAVILGEERRFAESEQLEGEAIDLERRVYGPDHFGVLMAMANQADTLYLMGKYSEAKQLLQQTLDIQRRVFDPNHPETARSLYNLGCLAARDSKRDEAFSLLGQAIDHLSPRSVPKVDNDPDLNSLHGDPRFAKLVARAKQRVVSDARCPL